MILRARVVLPLSAEPISNGAVQVSGHRVVWVGRWGDRPSEPQPVTDLGEVALLPGLVNTHCHLDYTQMAGQFLPPEVFTNWLQSITATKAGWGYSDYAQSWLQGAHMLVRTGTTTVGDIEAVPELLPEVWDATPLRVISFLEMIGIRGDRSADERLRDTTRHMERLESSRCHLGLSPHAPYSTLPEFLRLVAHTANRRRWRVSIHAAESGLEFEMFAHARGGMYEWLKRSGRDMSDCGLGSPVRHIERCGLLRSNLLLAHVNYLGPGDAELLARRRTHVAHCPRCHAYFRHDAFSLPALIKAGVNVCLGTDSLASVYKRQRQAIELNLFEEMQALALKDPGLQPRRILEMATINGARALGMRGRVGELAPGARGDLVAVPFTGAMTDLYESVLHHQGSVTASLIDGRWVWGLQGVPPTAAGALPPRKANPPRLRSRLEPGS